jgi:hypothetical protein
MCVDRYELTKKNRRATSDVLLRSIKQQKSTLRTHCTTNKKKSSFFFFFFSIHLIQQSAVTNIILLSFSSSISFFILQNALLTAVYLDISLSLSICFVIFLSHIYIKISFQLLNRNLPLVMTNCHSMKLACCASSLQISLV